MSEESILVEYHYFVCQKCGFIGGNSDFSHISQTQFDYDVNFECPKCHTSKAKKRVGMIGIELAPLKLIESQIKKVGSKEEKT